MFKKIIVPGVLSSIVMLLVGMTLSRGFMLLFPQLEAEYQNASLFRSWSDPAMLLYFAQPFITGLILAWIWDKTKIVFPAGGNAANGVRLGFVYWLFSLGGMVISYSSFPISLIMVGAWYLSILIQGIFSGILLAKLNPR